MSDWISVKDRLPEKNDRVLCFSPQAAGAETGGISVQWGWMCKSCKSSDITHWQPLPEPPKKEVT